MDSEKAVNPIRLNDCDVFLVLEWEKDKALSLKILNIEERVAYEGQATDADLRSQAAKIRLSYSDFKLKTRDALFKSSAHQSNYLYSLDQTGENYVFKWKSIDSEETVISLGSLALEKTNFYSFLVQFLFSFADEMQSMKASIENLSKELTSCKGQLSTALSNLSNSVNLKMDMEKELYSKFALLMNEKKRKINELQNNKDSCSPIIKKKKVPIPKRVVSSDESDTEFRNNLSTTSCLNNKKTNPPDNTVASCEPEEKSVPNTSQLNKETKSNNLLNILFSDSESDVDGEIRNPEPGPSRQRLDSSLPFDDDEIKPLPETQIRKRKAAPPVSKTVPVPFSHSSEHLSDDGSVDSLMDLW